MIAGVAIVLINGLVNGRWVGGPAALTVPGIGGGVIVGWLSGVVVEHRRGKQSRVRDADSREAALLTAKDAERPSTSEKDQGLTNSSS